MTSCVETKPKTKPTVGMGQILVERGPGVLGAVLGSCVGVALYHPRFRVGALAHVVLPDSTDRKGSPGKFADTAIPEMIKMLLEEKVPKAGLIAKITGGAKMFGTSDGPMQIGNANAKAVNEALKVVGISVKAENLGGEKGRRVTFDCQTGELKVEVVGCEPVIL